MATNLLDILDFELEEFPDRASGEQLYEYIGKQAARYSKSDRSELVVALMEWLKLRSEPKTMIALDIAGNLRLSELRPEIEMLLRDVEQGKVFLPFYAKPIRAVLAVI